MCIFSEISNHKRKPPERYVRKMMIKDTNDYHFKKTNPDMRRYWGFHFGKTHLYLLQIRAPLRHV